MPVDALGLTVVSSTTTPHRRIRRAPEVAEREILDAAEALLAERSYRELSVDELMRRTGMTRSSFYHYFGSLDELAVALLGRVQAEMVQAAAPWVATAAQTDDPAGNIENGILGVARVFASHGPVLAAIDEAAHHHQTVEQAWREGVLAPWITAIATQVRANRDRGLTAIEEPEEVAATLSRIWIAALYPEGLLGRG